MIDRHTRFALAVILAGALAVAAAASIPSASHAALRDDATRFGPVSGGRTAPTNNGYGGAALNVPV